MKKNLMILIGAALAYVTLMLMAPMPIHALIIDNGANGTSHTGSWSVSGAEDCYGEDSLYSKDVGATYSYETTMDGEAEVSMWWTEWNSRPEVAEVRVYDGDALLNTVLVNQKEQGGQWNALGTYDFNGQAKVTIVSEGTNYSTCADAVQFVGPTTRFPVTVTWEYGPDNGVQGFTLMVNDGIMIDIPGVSIRIWDGDIPLVVGDNAFVMRAYQSETEYSVWTEPFIYILSDDPLLAPTNIVIEVTK